MKNHSYHVGQVLQDGDFWGVVVGVDVVAKTVQTRVFKDQVEAWEYSEAVLDDLARKYSRQQTTGESK